MTVRRFDGQSTTSIDVAFDVRTDAGGGDPDSCSATLRRYHKLLWSKPLPGGALFDLSDTTPHAYLYHRSPLGEFVLTSDSVIPTFAKWKALRPITQRFPTAENEAFRKIAYTIGAMMVFPGNRVDGRPTINGARGLHPSIRDRFDLTIECIRRHYLGEPSPLTATLARYTQFLALFGDFGGYVQFFLLNDLVTEELQVRFFMAFDNFGSPAVPKDVDVYRDYRRRSIEFINARNDRVHELNP